MLFTTHGPSRDAAHLSAFIAAYYREMGVTDYVDIDGATLQAVVRQMHEDFPHPGGQGNASSFKQIAQFVCYFAALKPIATPLPDWALGDLGHQNSVARSNAIVPLEIAIESLYGATVQWRDGETHILEQKIELSQHSYFDIAHALTNITPDTAFQLVSVLFEQMAYKTNPSCQYPT